MNVTTGFRLYKNRAFTRYAEARSWRAKNQQRTTEFIAFDVIYEDGSQRSNRRVASADIDPIDGDKSVQALIEEQDRKIEEMSGKSRGPIKSVKRSPVR